MLEEVYVEELPDEETREVNITVLPINGWEEWRIRVPRNASEKWIAENLSLCEFLELEESGNDGIELEEILEG